MKDSTYNNELNDRDNGHLILAEGATTARRDHLRQTSVKEGGEMSMEGGRMTEIREMLHQLNGTRMTRIGWISTDTHYPDTHYPCASASTV